MRVVSTPTVLPVENLGGIRDHELTPKTTHVSLELPLLDPIEVHVNESIRHLDDAIFFALFLNWVPQHGGEGDYERAGGALAARYLTSGVTAIAVDFASLGGEPGSRAVARFAAAEAFFAIGIVAGALASGTTGSSLQRVGWRAR